MIVPRLIESYRGSKRPCCRACWQERYDRATESERVNVWGWGSNAGYLYRQIVYTMKGFEWDEGKNALNIKKHGIAFEDAQHIFDDPVFERADERRDYGERRIIALGALGRRVLAVVYTRRGTVRRLISARKANRNESQAHGRSLAKPKE